MSTTSLQLSLAADMIRRYGLTADTLVIEVGSGEGAFLRSLQKHGVRVLGIEPKLPEMVRAWALGVDTLAAHFGVGVAEYVRMHYGPVKLLISRSVRAGTEEFARLVAGGSRCLSADGTIAIHSAGVNALVEVRPDPIARAA